MTENNRTILVVDDNNKNRKLLCVILEKSGYTVKEATNGLEGVECANSIHPDLVLMDYRMPTMNGIKATQIIKSSEKTGTIPVFIVTSSAMEKDRDRISADSGCDELFTKPINYQVILNTINEYLGERS